MGILPTVATMIPVALKNRTTVSTDSVFNKSLSPPTNVTVNHLLTWEGMVAIFLTWVGLMLVWTISSYSKRAALYSAALKSIVRTTILKLSR